MNSTLSSNQEETGASWSVGIKPLEELTLADNFLFTETMRQADFCQLFLESLLHKKIARIQFISKERDCSDTYSFHGIRLDIYLEDEENTRYCIEMQQAPQRALPRRIRYYQGGIDRDFLGRSEAYDALPESYIIFICNHDPIGKGLALYERISTFKDVDNAQYEDGSHVFILNTHYTPDGMNTNKSIQEFLDYVRESDNALPPSTKLGQIAREKVEDVKNDNTIRSKYMQTAAILYDTKREGLEEGLEQGLEQGRKEVIKKLAKQHSVAQISSMLKMPVDAINKILAA